MFYLAVHKRMQSLQTPAYTTVARLGPSGTKLKLRFVDRDEGMQLKKYLHALNDGGRMDAPIQHPPEITQMLKMVPNASVGLTKLANGVALWAPGAGGRKVVVGIIHARDLHDPRRLNPQVPAAIWRVRYGDQNKSQGTTVPTFVLGPSRQRCLGPNETVLHHSMPCRAALDAILQAASASATCPPRCNPRPVLFPPQASSCEGTPASPRVQAHVQPRNAHFRVVMQTDAEARIPTTASYIDSEGESDSQAAPAATAPTASWFNDILHSNTCC